MSCFYTKNKKGMPQEVSCGVDDNILGTPKFYTSAYMQSKPSPVKPELNIIYVALNTIGLSLSDIPCGELPKYDVYNMSAPQVLKLGLLEGIKKGKFYELYLNESGDPFILSIGDTTFVPKTVYYSVVHVLEKVNYCVIVKGLDPMPERIVKDTIPLVVNGEGNGVEIIGLGKFQYATCDSKIFDYHGSISYGDPNLQDTTKDEMDSIFELEPFESLIGYAYICKKPEDVDVVFSDTTQMILDFGVKSGDASSFERAVTFGFDSIEIGMDITEERKEEARDICNPCILIEPENMPIFFESNTAILNVDQVLVIYDQVDSYDGAKKNEYDVCGVHTSQYSSSGEVCDVINRNTVVRQLNVGQDFYYKIESEPDGTNKVGSELIKYTLRAAIPYIHYDFYVPSMTGSRLVRLVKLIGAPSHVGIPFTGVVLVTIDKPSIQIKKETDTAIGRISQQGAAFVEDHTEIIKEIAKEITLCAIPIVTLDKPSNTAYYVDGETTLIKMEDCIQDNDPTTEEDLQNTPCEVLAQSSSGKATIDVTLPFLETDKEIEDTASLLGEKFSANYKQSVSTVPGHDMSASDLGKNFNGGLINKIVWSYQDKSFYKATVTSGPFLTGVDSFNTSMWIRRTDQSLSREGIVVGDHGNGLEFKVYVRNIGTYTALNMTMSTIEVGDAVNVTIHNNPAETYYE